MVREAGSTMSDEPRGPRGASLQKLAPPQVGPFRDGAFRSPLHSVRVASILGIALGITFTLCFVTGFTSHLIQHPPSSFTWPARPAWLFRVSQGLHVATGIASIPLLLAKLWTVYPRFWTYPPVRTVAHAVERLALLPLVGGSLFLLFSGVASIFRWFPWEFSFPPAHYAAAWIAIGALLVHIGAKAAAARLALSSRSHETAVDSDRRRAGMGRVVASRVPGCGVRRGRGYRRRDRRADRAAARRDLGARSAGSPERAARRADQSHRCPGEGRRGRDRSLLPAVRRGQRDHASVVVRRGPPSDVVEGGRPPHRLRRWLELDGSMGWGRVAGRAQRGRGAERSFVHGDLMQGPSGYGWPT